MDMDPSFPSVVDAHIASLHAHLILLQHTFQQHGDGLRISTDDRDLMLQHTYQALHDSDRLRESIRTIKKAGSSDDSSSSPAPVLDVNLSARLPPDALSTSGPTLRRVRPFPAHPNRPRPTRDATSTRVKRSSQEPEDEPYTPARKKLRDNTGQIIKSWTTIPEEDLGPEVEVQMAAMARRIDRKITGKLNEGIKRTRSLEATDGNANRVPSIVLKSGHMAKQSRLAPIEESPPGSLGGRADNGPHPKRLKKRNSDESRSSKRFRIF